MSLYFVVFGFLVYSAAAQNLPWTYPNYTNHECIRTCNGIAKRCYYKFVAEDWFTNTPNCLNCLSGNEANCNNPECIPADGRNKHIMTFNRMFPGPGIHVCQGDEIMVDVQNDMVDLTTTIHWHGIHQLDTQWMDGVPMVSQCPIQPHTTFRYHFKAYAYGTHFYHSHSGTQRVDGLFGPLVIRQTQAKNRHASQYTNDLPEHYISLNDNYNMTSRYHFFANIRLKNFDFGMIVGVMINGRGTTDTNRVPPKRFMVTRGNKYRFRVVHAGGEPCDMQLEIQGHRMTIIASDGKDIVPFTVDKLTLTNGERYDFVLNANNTVDTYVMRLTGGIICGNRRSYAVVQYTGAAAKTIRYDAVVFPTNGLTANCVNQPLNNRCYNYVNMSSVETMPARMKQTPDFGYFIGFDIYEYAQRSLRGAGDAGLTKPFMNNISMTTPTRPLLLNHLRDNTQKICSVENMNRSYCDGQFCECVHMIKIQLNSLVEFIYVDEGNLITLTHATHLHGYEHWTVGQGKLGIQTTTRAVRRLEETVGLPRNFNNPPLKDTVQVQSGGYTIVRFLADNPGYWLLHCHVDFHADEGMMMVVMIDDFTSPSSSRIIYPNEMQNCGDYLRINSFLG